MCIHEFIHVHINICMYLYINKNEYEHIQMYISIYRIQLKPVLEGISMLRTAKKKISKMKLKIIMILKTKILLYQNQKCLAI
jgi:hypothetical protein